MAKARERRSALDQDRVARDRRVEEATAQVLLQLQERAAAEQAVQVANAQIGTVLRRLLDEKGIAAHGVGGLVDLTVGEVRRLARAVPTEAGEGQVQTAGGAVGGSGAGGHLAAVPPLEGVTREPAAPGGRDAGARRPHGGHGLTLPRCRTPGGVRGRGARRPRCARWP